VASARSREARSERFEGCLAATYENEIVSTLCETVCIASPDALEAPVTRAVPFDGELLISFFSGRQLTLFAF
jgi:hypothetical protein